MKSKKLPSKNKITKARVPDAADNLKEGQDQGDSKAFGDNAAASIVPNKNTSFEAPKKDKKSAGVGLVNQVRSMQKNKKPGVIS